MILIFIDTDIENRQHYILNYYQIRLSFLFPFIKSMTLRLDKIYRIVGRWLHRRIICTNGKQDTIGLTVI